MSTQLLVWPALVLLALLCLPIAATRKPVLEVYGWALRLALLGLLVAGGVLWFRPDLLPAEASGVLDQLPGLRTLLPEPGSPAFGGTVAALVAVLLLPALAVVDVTRKLAGRRPLVVEQPAPVPQASIPAPAAPVVAAAPPEATAPPAAEAASPPPPARDQGTPSPAARRGDRRAAAEAMAAVSSRKPFRVADHLS